MPACAPLQALLQISATYFTPTRPTLIPSSSPFALARRSISVSYLSSSHCGRSKNSKLSRNKSRLRCLVQEENRMTGEVCGAAAYPLQRCKTIYLVRHGQGFHNVAGEHNRAAYLLPEFFDASLTALGWQQVAALRNHVRSSGIPDSLQLVVVSPLTRTMQTAVGVFGGEDILNGNSAEAPLMVDGVGMEKHKAISSIGAPPFVAVEWCREHMGIHPCDQRQSVTTYKSLFPAIDFTDIEDEEDVLWSPTEREPEEELFGRARNFVQWLLKRKETDIAVVSHSSFLWHLMATFGDDSSTQIQSELHKYFENCEMRSIVLVDKRAEESSKVASKDYPGGIPAGADAPSDSAEA